MSDESHAATLAAASVPEFSPAFTTVKMPPPPPYEVPTRPAEVTVNVDAEIEKIFSQNRLDDLKKFLSRRRCLNVTNMGFDYMFHVVQTSGILITTIAAGYNEKFLVWVGAGVSALASLIKVFETSNNAMLKKLLGDIKSIREGTYVDEGSLVESDKKEHAGESK
jgi:hypothetical protein